MVLRGALGGTGLSAQAKPQRRMLIILEGKELGPWQYRPFYANQSSELNFPIFLGKNGPKSEERGIFMNILPTAMAQVLPFALKAPWSKSRSRSQQVSGVADCCRKLHKCNFQRTPWWGNELTGRKNSELTTPLRTVRSSRHEPALEAFVDQRAARSQP